MGSLWPPTGVLGAALGGAGQPAGIGSEDHPSGSNSHRAGARGRRRSSQCVRGRQGQETPLLGKAALCLAGRNGDPQIGTRTLRPPPRKRAG